MLGRRHEGGRVGCHSPCSDFRPAPTLPQLSPHVWRSQTPVDIVRGKPLKSLGWSCPLLPRRKSLCTPTAPRPVGVLRCWFQETVKALMHQSRRDEGGGSISIMVEHPPLVARPASALDFALPLRCWPERKSPATHCSRGQPCRRDLHQSADSWSPRAKGARSALRCRC